MNLAAVKEILGHRSIVTTQKYARLSETTPFAPKPSACGIEPDHLPDHPAQSVSQGNVVSSSAQRPWAVSSGGRAPAF
jgi:hypothetical protein